MKKNYIVLAVIAVIICIVVLVLVVPANKINEKDNNNTQNSQTETLKIETAEDMKNVIDKIYEKVGQQLPKLDETHEIDLTDEYAVSYNTGLNTVENIKYIVVSEPFISAQAYSLVMVKVQDSSNVQAVKQSMFDNIDTRKWICVEAEKVYVTNYEDVIFLVMSSEEWAKPVYDEFKALTNNKYGEELERGETLVEE